MDGSSYYFIRLEGEAVFYSISAAQNREVVTLSVGNLVIIEHAVAVEDSHSTILDAYTLTVIPPVPPAEQAEQPRSSS